MHTGFAVRITARFHINAFHKEADLTLPTSSSIDDVLPEIIQLVGAPTITRPWQATTAAGMPLNHFVPLSELPLADGAVIQFAPAEDVPAPVVRDSAEALVAAADAKSAHGMATVWGLLGLTALALVASTFVPLAAAAGVAAVLGLAVGLWARIRSASTSPAYAPWVTVAAAVAGFRGVAGASAMLDESPSSSATALITGPAALVHGAAHQLLPASLDALALGMVGAAVCALVALGLCHAVGLSGPKVSAAIGTAIGLTLVAAAGLYLPGPGTNPAPAIAAAACTIAAAVIMVAVAPGLTTRAAGLKVPQLPTAGQDLAVSDTDQPDVDDRAARARALYDGIACGLAIVAIPALLVLATSGTRITNVYDGFVGTGLDGAGFAQALCLTVAGATVIHAARHGQVIASWALTCVSIGAASAACLTAWLAWADFTDGRGHVGLIVAAAIVAAIAISAPLWAHTINTLEPTTIVWAERAEALAVAACLPLAAHLAGIFAIIRGLGA